MNLLSILVGLFMWIIELIIIQSSVNDCEDGDVRLRGGSHYREGRVEVCRNRQWGRVYDDEWDERDSAVVCRQLGLSDEGAKKISSHFVPESTDALPFILDDVGCNGSESNILDCLPHHNCDIHENAGVQCLRKGVRLEHSYLGQLQEITNSSLITVDNGKGVLFCSTDREDCCINEIDINIAGNWFLPNGSKVSSINTEPLLVTLGNQTVGLNIWNILEIPAGIYHCEMTDRKNVTHYLYAGIYLDFENEGDITGISVKYNRVDQTITCTTSGGPATEVAWFKDDEMITMTPNEGLYEHSQIIISTTNATYENRLRIVDKSSTVAGTYTCKVTNSRGSRNESLYIQVCRDMEFKVNNKSSGQGKTVEVCIDDHWHEAASRAKVANNSLSVKDISIQADSASVMIIWSEQSIPNDKIINEYDLSCTTSALSDGQIHEVKVPNISASTTKFQVDGLRPGTAYECCVSAHIQTNTPLDLISSTCSCATTKTKANEVPGSDDLAVGLGTGLGLLLVVVCVGSIFVNILLVMHLRNSATTNFIPNEGHEEDDSDHDERLVGNPIYSGSRPTAGENSISERENYDVLNHNMGTGATGVNPIGAYEMISNLPTQPNRDVQTLQTIDASAAYAKLGADGIGANADENVRVGVKENELGAPYANIFEISPSD